MAFFCRCAVKLNGLMGAAAMLAEMEASAGRGPALTRDGKCLQGTLMVQVGLSCVLTACTVICC